MALQVKIPPRTTPLDRTLLGKKGNENYFCSVLLGEIPLKVILYLAEGDPLGQLLLKRCRDADYDCCLVHQESQVIQNITEQTRRHQVVVLVDVMATTGAEQNCNNLEHLSKSLSSNGLDQKAGLIGLMKDLESTKDVDQTLQNGVSRLLTREECRGNRFLWELKMIENCEVLLRERQIFGLALYEAVDQSNDAIQITGTDSNIMYVNRAFLELSGYSSEEVIGQPAWDILKPYDSSKPDNGPKGAVRKGQGWDGICMGRRKSGGILKQHLKLIPVRNAADYVHHHVTIQRLLSVHESDTGPRSPRVVRPNDKLMLRQGSSTKILPRLESPLTKAVQMLHSAKENPDTPGDVRDILEKAIESLSSSELYTIPTSSKNTGGIVSGLLLGGPRFPQTYKSRTPQPHQHHLPQNPPISPNPPEVQLALKNIDEWNFDIINMETVTKARPLYYCGMRIFSQFDVCSTLNIDMGVLASWLKLMEDHYHHQNPYHNSTHAADVLQATAYFVKLLQDNLVLQGEVLEHSEVASLLISAAVHDLDHPARTNPYLCNTRHELAILYNDCAVLENHHVASCFKLTEQSTDVNIFQNLDTAAYRTMRKSIIELVLATDMAKHFEHLTKFNTMFKMGEDVGSTTNLCGTVGQVNKQNRMIMKKIMVKCADICNPCRPLPLCKEWAHRIAEEYFAQTDDEKQQNLPVVFPDFDRHTCRLPVTQVKFIDYFITGLFEAWNSFCPIPTLMDCLKSNYEHWKSGCPDSPNYSEEEPELMTNSS